ncbi:hypothetical protein Tco_0571079 [Tanacetum coccineum]
MYHKTTLASDTSIDFQIDFSISIGEIVTHWFTHIVLSALRHSGNENIMSLMNLMHIVLERLYTSAGSHVKDDSLKIESYLITGRSYGIQKVEAVKKRMKLRRR